MHLDLNALIAYLQENPLTAIGCVLGLGLVFYLLQRKPAIQREADERLATLGKAHSSRYDRLRPLE
jgi:hypothetical protein